MTIKVLVTGADQHQGLAVIRGLGQAGFTVVAASAQRHNNIGFASRYAREKALYTSPHADLERFVADIVEIARRHEVDLVLPAVESTLVALDRYRERLQRHVPLAAPDSATLAWAVDKLKTAALADELGIPAPRTLYSEDLEELLATSGRLRFPVALKPRGNALNAETRNRLDFKVKYARTPAELEQMLRAMHAQFAALPLVQEYVSGTGVCVAAIFDRGEPVVMLPYQRVREFPLTGGVSVLRRTLPQDERVEGYVTRLLQKVEWHGAAMVEFKYEAGSDRYTLMEINGRFPASTALSLDAGVNLPQLACCLHAGLPLPTRPIRYRAGVEERWLRGDLSALAAHLSGKTRRDAVPEAQAALPSRARAAWEFLCAFRPGMCYDEFKWEDPLPGLIEAVSMSRALATTAARAARVVARGAWGTRAPSREVRPEAGSSVRTQGQPRSPLLTARVERRFDSESIAPEPLQAGPAPERRSGEPDRRLKPPAGCLTVPTYGHREVG
jgi:predicted ATP-grasp superfamily ATP-dependent carboligase